jgi:hypothetical protein
MNEKLFHVMRQLSNTLSESMMHDTTCDNLAKYLKNCIEKARKKDKRNACNQSFNTKQYIQYTITSLFLQQPQQSLMSAIAIFFFLEVHQPKTRSKMKTVKSKQSTCNN